MKPVEELILSEVLKKAWNTMRQSEMERLVIQVKSSVFAVPFRKIIYVESEGHQLTVHTEERILTTYEKLEDIKNRLSSDFLQCHKSYLVNMNYIRRIENKRIVMKSGKDIPISKAKYAQTKESFFGFLGDNI